MGEVKQISIRNRTRCFYNDMISLKDFKSNLLKIDSRTKTLILTTLDTLRFKKLMIVKVFTA